MINGNSSLASNLSALSMTPSGLSKRTIPLLGPKSSLVRPSESWSILLHSPNRSGCEASQPERLGEWRRILQDSLGLTRDDFGPNSGIVLFERPEGVIERADRLEANEELPFIIIDAAETSVEIPILQFPLWIAFAGSDNEIYDDLELN